jgi:hypothetical protein
MHITYSIFLCMLFCSILSNAQQAALDTIQVRFKNHREQLLQEKIYLHIDRGQYITGETMWFKIYYTDGVRHRPLQMSKVCYVEIIDEVGTPMVQTKVKLQKGGGNGSLFIPATMNTGNYTVRAYTNWMKNSSPDYFFHTNITILNPFRTPELIKPSTARQPDAQFFPEGGSLVAGIRSKVGFRVTDESGTGIEFKGAVINPANDTVAIFEPLRLGIGSFSFTPQPDVSYRAVLQLPNGKTYNYTMPSAHSQGYILEVIDNKNETLVGIRSNVTEAASALLFIHTRQMIQLARVIILKDGEATVKINKKDLPDGTTHITLFDASGIPVCERLIFKKPVQRSTLDVKADQTTYDLRRKGNLELEVSSMSATTNLSVAIYKLDSLPSATHDDITTYFWLTSDLSGAIESPEYYLSDTDSLVEAATDNLMLTHGWRRFSWDKMLHQKPVISYMPEIRGHVMSAEILDGNNKPSSGISSFLTAPGKIVRVYGSRSNELGKAFYETIDFYGPNKIYVQTNLRRDTAYSIRVANPFSEQFSNRKIPPLMLGAKAEDAIVERSVAMQVQNIYPNEKFNKVSNPVLDSTAFFGKADETYYLDDFTRFPVMEEVMREYVPGVLVRKRRDGFHFVLLDKVNSGVLRDDPVILLDGFPIWDADDIMKFDPLKVRKLEVVNRLYYLGSMFFPGIVSYSTYQGDLAGLELNRHVVSLDYEGLQYGREYYSPVYEDKTSRSTRLPDQRSLIYWNGDVKLKSGQKQFLPFYTSDIKGKFVVEVQGLSEDGQPVSATTSFDVRRFDY